jgi:hypothetical protein
MFEGYSADMRTGNNNIDENGRQPQVNFKWKTTSKKIIFPKTIKSKNNGVGTAPGFTFFILLKYFCSHRWGSLLPGLLMLLLLLDL